MLVVAGARMTVENELKQRDAELRERNFEVLALKEQVESLIAQQTGTRATIEFLAKRLGQYQHQRDRALWKLGRGKRIWREWKREMQAAVDTATMENEELRNLLNESYRAAEPKTEKVA